MKAVAKALYAEPVVFLLAIQGAATALAETNVIPGWIPLVTIGIVAPVLRRFVTPAK